MVIQIFLKSFTCVVFSSTFFASISLALCVKKSQANLRSKPSSSEGKVQWIVGKNMPLKYIKKKGSWYQVGDVDGELHWVHNSMVTQGWDCLVVRKNFANLRQGPGEGYGRASLRNVDRYTPFRKILRDGEWLKIQDNYDGVYWVHESNVWEPLSYASVGF